MTRPARRRLTLPSLALYAWLGFATIASAWPFLFSTVVWEPGGHAMWGAQWGSLSRLTTSNHRSTMGDMGKTVLRWDPGIRQGANFMLLRASSTRSSRRPQPWLIEFPPWAVLLAPTLLFLGGHQCIRVAIRRRRVRHAKRMGRTLCPACNYDVTGLEACPECGTPSARRESKQASPTN